MFPEGIGSIALTTVLGGLFQPHLSAFDRPENLLMKARQDTARFCCGV
jgi:hypothetical protein